MTRCQYTPEFKSKVVLNILQGNQELNEICAQHNLNPNMVRKWKQEFLQNAYLVFGAKSEHKQSQRKEGDLKKKNDQMLKTIGQLTMERNFLQDWHTTMPYLGSRKITKLLVHEGFKVCRKTVRILLERMSITSIYPKVRPHEALSYKTSDSYYYGQNVA